MLRVATSLCSSFGARLVLHHQSRRGSDTAVDSGTTGTTDHSPPSPRQGASTPERLGELLAGLPAGLHYDVRVTSGSSRRDLLDLAARLPADLVVVGPGPSSPEDETLRDRIVARTHCAVVSMGETRFDDVPGPRSQRRTRGRSMLVAVGSERTKPVVDLAFDLAQRSHHELHLLHVLTPTWGEMDDDLQSDVAEGVRRKLLSLLPSQPEVEVRLHVATGLPAAEIVRVAREIRARFTVLGSYRRDATTFERSICRDVLHHSRCPVWLVPPPTGQPATTGPSREIRH